MLNVISLKIFFFPHPSLFVLGTKERQIKHWNYAILMTIKLLIRNKKVLDVTI